MEKVSQRRQCSSLEAQLKPVNLQNIPRKQDYEFKQVQLNMSKGKKTRHFDLQGCFGFSSSKDKQNKISLKILMVLKVGKLKIFHCFCLSNSKHFEFEALV